MNQETVYMDEYVSKLCDDKRTQFQQLYQLFKEISGYEGVLWGPSMVGFGEYHYEIDEKFEGDAPLVAFAIKKNKISLYLAPDNDERDVLLKSLGKHTVGKTCVYINQVEDIDKEVLKTLIKSTIAYLKKKY